MTTPKHYALVGNPNSGKTALFNRLTKSNQKIANYAGATIEKKQGFLRTKNVKKISILDLPGAYSLETTSPEEALTRDYCLQRLPQETPPDALIYIADASNLRLHLHFLLELIPLGLPIILVLNKYDSAQEQGIHINTAGLSQALGIPVIPSIAINSQGADALINVLEQGNISVPTQAFHFENPTEINSHIKTLLAQYTKKQTAAHTPLDDKIDRILLHPILGTLFLIFLLFIIFQAVYSWAAPIQALIEETFVSIGEFTANTMSIGPLNSLIVNGIIAGCASVLVFLPQILILFFFILILEESGYLPRAAFLLDPLMRKVGLSGRSFIPLLSSFACAVPGIMATRAIQHQKDRLVTIMIAPLMTCSARLPVYALLIAAFIPKQSVLGIMNLQGLILLALYVAGIISALTIAWLTKNLRKDSDENPLLLEIPNYRLPRLYNLGIGLWERASIFIKRVGTVILALTIVLWALLYFPILPAEATGNPITHSFAGQIGQFFTYLFTPLGFNLAICIALIPGMAARELAVSSLATVYALSNANDNTQGLTQIIQQEWSLATGMSLLVWYIFAPMCIATLATIRRETMSLRFTINITLFLFALAYLASFITYQLVNFLS